MLLQVSHHVLEKTALRPQVISHRRAVKMVMPVRRLEEKIRK